MFLHPKSKNAKLAEYNAKKTQCTQWDTEMNVAAKSFYTISAELEELRGSRTKVRDRIKEIAPADLQLKIQQIVQQPQIIQTGFLLREIKPSFMKWLAKVI